MSKNNNNDSQVDNETILMTLDQMGQTIDIMVSVVDRLRGYITEEITEKQPDTTKQQCKVKSEIPMPPTPRNIH